MASEKLHPGAKGHALDPKRVTLRIFPNGGGQPVWSHEGGVASITRDSAGKFFVTLTEGYYLLSNCQATYQSALDNADIYAQLGEFNNVHHKGGAVVGTPGLPVTFFVKLKTGATNTDVGVAPQTCIFVDLTFEDIARA
jgi:hypothetical protein